MLKSFFSLVSFHFSFFFFFLSLSLTITQNTQESMAASSSSAASFFGVRQDDQSHLLPPNSSAVAPPPPPPHHHQPPPPQQPPLEAPQQKKKRNQPRTPSKLINYLNWNLLSRFYKIMWSIFCLNHWLVKKRNPFFIFPFILSLFSIFKSWNKQISKP